MKLLTALMQPFLLDRATRALRANDLTRYVISKSHCASEDLQDGQIPYAKDMVKLEIALHDSEVVLLLREATTHQEVTDTVIWSVPMFTYDDGNEKH